MNDIDILVNAIEAIVDKKLNEIKLEIEQLNNQIQMIQTQPTELNAFFETVSYRKISNAPKNFVNPAFQE
jgi:prefoldin subunit 5